VVNLKRSVLKLIHSEGHKLTTHVEDNAVTVTKDQLKQTKEQLKKESIAAICGAPVITEKQVEELKDKQHLTQEQQDSIEQYYIRRNCGTDKCTEELAAWYMDKGKAGIRNYVDTYVKPLGLLLEQDTADKYENGVFSPDQRKQAAACELRRKLVPEDILNGAVFSHDRLHTSGWVAQAQENAEAMKALLGITFNAAKPVQGMTTLLEQLGLEVESRGKVRVSKATCGGTEKDTTFIGVSENVTKTSVPALDGKRVRLYAITPESLERMAGIVKRTKEQLAWRWYSSIRETKTRLSYQYKDNTGETRLANLNSVLRVLEPLVKEKLEREQEAQAALAVF
jgi:hypothetical protein